MDHAFSLIFDLNQILFHFSQPLPGHVIRVHVECSLDGPHPVLEEHDIERLFSGGNGIIESEQVRVGCLALLRFNNNL